MMKRLIEMLIFCLLLIGFALNTFAADVTLNWDASPSVDVAKYNVYRAEIQADVTTAWQFAGSVNHPAVTFTDVGLDDAKTFMWYVDAEDGSANKSGPSNMAFQKDVVAPGSPLNLQKQ